MTEPGPPWPLLRSIARVADAPLGRLAELLREAVLPFRADTADFHGRLHMEAAEEGRLLLTNVACTGEMHAPLRPCPLWSYRRPRRHHAVLREVRTAEELDFDIEPSRACSLAGLGWCCLMLQWLSLNDSPEGISADEWVRMLQSALPARKYEPGRGRPEVVPSPGPTSARSWRRSYRHGRFRATMLTCSGLT
jgi:hypothetical protein